MYDEHPRAGRNAQRRSTQELVEIHNFIIFWNKKFSSEIKLFNWIAFSKKNIDIELTVSIRCMTMNRRRLAWIQKNRQIPEGNLFIFLASMDNYITNKDNLDLFYFSSKRLSNFEYIYCQPIYLLNAAFCLFKVLLRNKFIIRAYPPAREASMELAN